LPTRVASRSMTRHAPIALRLRSKPRRDSARRRLESAAR
jgi:hypothetical protein